MRMLSALIILVVTATSIAWGANQTARANGLDYLRSRVSSRAGKGKRAGGPGVGCPTNGFSPTGLADCVCNFVGGCDLTTGTKTPTAIADPTNLVGIAPTGMNNFAINTPGNVGTICEGGAVAVLYDCDGRIPLYTATVIEATNAKGSFKRGCWKGTSDSTLLANPNLLANNNDYDNANNRYYCYEDSATSNEFEWDGTTPCPAPKPKVTIHRGHMIAARYGQGHGGQPSVDATFFFTNAVPQIGSFNSGKWNGAEAGVIKRAKNCQKNAAAKSLDAKLYVVVGVVPSSYVGKPRWFGSAGFGNFQGMSKNVPLEHFRVSFPEIMWTAGCCIHTDGTVAEKFAFWRRNWPTKDVVKQFSSATLMFADIDTEIKKAWPTVNFHTPTIFPAEPNCE